MTPDISPVGPDVVTAVPTAGAALMPNELTVSVALFVTAAEMYTENAPVEVALTRRMRTRCSPGAKAPTEGYCELTIDDVLFNVTE